MILLDTNVVSELMRPVCDPIVERRIDGQEAETLFLSAISLAELRVGIAMMPAGKRRQSLAMLLDEIMLRVLDHRVLAFDAPAAEAYASLMAFARRNGRAIGTVDGQIAAIAQVRGFAVATRDTSPFLAAGVKVINPWEA
jgi:predicted nucleic acid-binding protein